MKDLYDYKFKYNYKEKDKVSYNKKIFKKCPFEVDEIKEINESRDDFIGVKGIRQWWTWWELVPGNIFNRIIYWIKFYPWYYMKFKSK